MEEEPLVSPSGSSKLAMVFQSLKLPSIVMPSGPGPVNNDRSGNTKSIPITTRTIKMSLVRPLERSLRTGSPCLSTPFVSPLPLTSPRPLTRPLPLTSPRPLTSPLPFVSPDPLVRPRLLPRPLPFARPRPLTNPLDFGPVGAFRCLIWHPSFFGIVCGVLLSQVS
jgi:hypothetical protein